MTEREAAIAAAKAAGEVHLQYFRNNNFEVSEKTSYRDVVTKADKESENVILSLLADAFPDYDVLAEESGARDNGSDYLWVIDPLDGTANFAKGHNDFCTLIALMHKGEVVLGVTYFPTTNELYVAERGKGAERNGEKLKVSHVSEIQKMYAATQMTSKLENRTKNLALYSKLLLEIRNIHVFNACIARALCDVAEGIVDFQFRRGFNLWDYAAGALLVEEAGGVATDFAGNPIALDSEDTLISNGVNHEELRSFVSSLL